MQVGAECLLQVLGHDRDEPMKCAALRINSNISPSAWTKI
jgi:hypothetical protein